MRHPETYIIIPMYNEEQVLEKTLKSVFKHFDNVVCVDDGSSDGTADIARTFDVMLVQHAINLGAGAATQTGIDFAMKDNKAKYFVSFDADGQHRIQDVKKMIAHLEKNPKLDLVTGSRFIGAYKNMPRSKKFALKLAVKYMNLTTGVPLTDAHNGLRVFTRRATSKLRITLPDMAHGSEIIHKIPELGLNHEEVPVTIEYTEYSIKKGQPIFNSINIAFDMFLSRMRKR